MNKNITIYYWTINRSNKMFQSIFISVQSMVRKHHTWVHHNKPISPRSQRYSTMAYYYFLGRDFYRNYGVLRHMLLHCGKKDGILGEHEASPYSKLDRLQIFLWRKLHWWNLGIQYRFQHYTELPIHKQGYHTMRVCC